MPDSRYAAFVVSMDILGAMASNLAMIAFKTIQCSRAEEVCLELYNCIATLSTVQCENQQGYQKCWDSAVDDSQISLANVGNAAFFGAGVVTVGLLAHGLFKRCARNQENVEAQLENQPTITTALLQG